MRATTHVCDGCGAMASAPGRCVAPAGWTRVHFSWTDDAGMCLSAHADICRDAMCVARALELARDGAGRRLRVVAESARSGR